MKKTVLFLFAIVTLTSCGPHRMKCGPRRCGVEKKIDRLMPESFQEKVNA